MPPDSKRLADLRQQIDRIDDSIHDLLMQRAELVEQVGEAKSDGGPPLRPAREVAILRRIFKRHKGRFPAPALIRIWREMISGFTAMQARMTVAVSGDGEDRVLRDLARDHYGAATPIIATGSATATVRAVADGRADLGVVPWPEAGQPDPWWPPLFSREPTAPRVIACLPFLTSGKDMQRAALVIARLPFEPTGEDRSLVAIEVAGDVSRSRLRQTLDRLGLPATQIWSWDDLGRGGDPIHLVEIDDHVADGDARLGQLAVALEGAISRAQSLGGFALPLRLQDAGGTPDTHSAAT